MIFSWRKVGRIKIIHYFCIAFQRKCGLEVWVSGLNQQFAKLPYRFRYQEFESPSFRFNIWRFRLAARTHASHAWNTGSIPVGATLPLGFQPEGIFVLDTFCFLLGK